MDFDISGRLVDSEPPGKLDIVDICDCRCGSVDGKTRILSGWARRIRCRRFQVGAMNLASLSLRPGTPPDPPLSRIPVTPCARRCSASKLRTKQRYESDVKGHRRGPWLESSNASRGPSPSRSVRRALNGAKCSDNRRPDRGIEGWAGCLVVRRERDIRVSVNCQEIRDAGECLRTSLVQVFTGTTSG